MANSSRTLRLALAVSAALAVGALGTTEAIVLAESGGQPVVGDRSSGARSEVARDAAGTATTTLTTTTTEASHGAPTGVQGRAQELAIRYLAPLLADWIEHARSAALAAGTAPIPPAIADQLRGFIPAEDLQRVRWRIGWPDSQGGEARLFHFLDTRAITLVDVVVFRDREIAGDPRIWAHELTHVRQFRELGVIGFARKYATDRNGLESEAWDATATYTAWAMERGLW